MAEKNKKANAADVRTEVEGNSAQQEDPNPVELTQQEAQAAADLNAAARQSASVKEDREALAESREKEADLQSEMTAKTDQEGAEDIRQHVYETADKAQGTGVRPLSNEGAPLTVFEQESQWFFKEQNEVEKQIDELEISRESQALFAGTPVNVFQTAEAGELGPVGSATVTTYVGETVHPYPPTDYNAAAIIAGDLTADPVLAELGLVVGSPMPPENNVHDLRETDGRVDTKDYMRRQRKPNDLIVEARRTKYPSTENPIQ